MWRIRAFELRAMRAVRGEADPRLRAPLHRHGGDRGRCLRGARATDDFITSTHRGHGHCVAKGLDLQPDDGRDHRSRGRLLPRARRQHAHHRDGQGDARRRRDRRRLVGHRRRRGARPPPAGQGLASSSASSATAPRTRASSTRPATWPRCSSAPVVFVCENNEWAISTPVRAVDPDRGHRGARRRLRLPGRDRGRERRAPDARA